MKQNMLILFFLGLLAYTLNSQSLRFKNFAKHRPQSLAFHNLKLLNSFVFGAKDKLKKETLYIYKSFGLMHLLTPSGMHLSAILILFKFFPRFRYLIVILFFISSFTITDFWSIKRVLIFSLFTPFIKDTKHTLIITFLLSLALGHYESSPLSFCFSFLFWGTIIFHDEGRSKLILKIFYLQLIVSLFFDQSLNAATLILNPLITSLFTLFFPIMCLGSFIYPIGSWIESFVLTPVVSCLGFINSFNFLLIQSSFIIFILLLFASFSKNKLLLILVLLCPIQKREIVKIANLRSKIVTLPDGKNFLESKNEKLVFIDKECKRKGIYFFCKKKPSAWGGPFF